MKQRHWRIGFGLGMLALVSACQLFPTGVTGDEPAASASPTPTPGPAGPGASPAASLAPGESPRPGASGTPTPRPAGSGLASPSPTPRASSTPMPSPVPTANVTFEAPVAGTDFTRESIDIRVRAVPPAGQTMTEIALFYDGRELKKQTGKGETFDIPAWNPNHVNNIAGTKDLGKVPFGDHTLRAVVKTSGSTTTKDLSFFKPFTIREWSATVPDGAATRALPNLAASRAYPAAYGYENRLYAFFGESPVGTQVNSIESLNLSLFQLTWGSRSPGGLTWRERPAVAGVKDKVYFVGGRQGGAPVNTAAYYDVYQQTTTAIPSLTYQAGTPPVTVAQPVWEAAAAILDGSALYVAGGTLTNDPSGASNRCFKLALNADGTPSGSWEEIAALPEGRMGGTLVAYNGALYLLGGQTNSGDRLEPILKYTPGASSWSRVGVLHRGLTHLGAAVLNNEIWVFGGNAGAAGLVRDVVKLDVGSGAVTTQLRTLCNLPVGRAGMGVAQAGGHVYLIGGESDMSPAAPAVATTVIRADTL